MNYLFEYKSFYKIGDLVIIEYWYDDRITPVVIKDIIGRKYLISHKNEYSKIKNAPDQLIKANDILDFYKTRNTDSK